MQYRVTPLRHSSTFQSIARRSPLRRGSRHRALCEQDFPMRWFLGTLAALIIAVAIYLGLAASSLATLASAARAGDIAKVLEKTDVKAVTRSLSTQIVNAYLDRIGATRKLGSMEKMLIN